MIGEVLQTSRLDGQSMLQPLGSDQILGAFPTCFFMQVFLVLCVRVVDGVVLLTEWGRHDGMFERMWKERSVHGVEMLYPRGALILPVDPKRIRPVGRYRAGKRNGTEFQVGV